MGCSVVWKCLVACLFFELSQQPMWPHSVQNRRWTHVSPISRHSTQPVPEGFTSWTVSRWVHVSAMGSACLISVATGSARLIRVVKRDSDVEFVCAAHDLHGE